MLNTYVFRVGEVIDQIQDKTDNVEVVVDEYGDTVDDYRDIGNRRMDNEIVERAREHQSTFGSGYEVPVYTPSRSHEDQTGFGYNDFNRGNDRAGNDDIFVFDKADSAREGFGQEDLFFNPRQSQSEYDVRNERVSYDYYEGRYPFHIKH